VAGGCTQAASVGGDTTRHGAQTPRAYVVTLERVEVCPVALSLMLLGLCGVA